VMMRLNYVANILGNVFGVSIVRSSPRHSVRFAKKYFKGNPVTVVEVGTYKGIHAEDLFKHLNIKLLYVIDPWLETKSYRNNSPKVTQKVLSMAEIEMGKRLKNKPFIKIKKFSDDAADDIKELVDFIYVDGDHSYEQAKKDMFNYWSKLKSGGIMAGHDITNSYDDYGVARAFFEFCSKFKLKPKVSRTDWWVVKEK